MPPGFYRSASEQTVYHLNSDRTYCAVISEAMMNRYGGFGQVHVVPDSSGVVTRGYAPLDPAACPWPDGDYRKAGSSTVFRLAGDTVCVVDPASLRRSSRIVAVENDANLALHKTFVGNCTRGG